MMDYYAGGTLFMKLSFGLFTLLIMLMVSCCSLSLAAERELTVLFTSDIHSYFSPTCSPVEGQVRQHGGAGRLATLLREHRNDHAILVDAGDFAMGTLLQAGYLTDAYELRLMGMLGFDATTFGNHEFDFSCDGAGQMIQSAIRSGDPLPALMIPANLDLSGNLTEKQQMLKNALTAAGSQRYIIKDVNGVRVAVFGLLGKDGISCAPTSAVTWQDPIEAAKAVVKEIGDQAEVILCISHSGSSADGKSGEDVELLKAVPELDVVISGHTHLAHHQVVTVRESGVLGSCGCFLSYLGRIDLTVDDAGKVAVKDYALLPVDDSVASDEALDAVVNGFWEEIDSGYLADTGWKANQVIAHTDFQLDDFVDGEEGRGELPLGMLIADSYLHACDENGYDDIEVGVVASGTIRIALEAGDITVADAFEVCSLGAGQDNSAGHPLVSGWVKGSDLKLLCEMDAAISPIMTTLKLYFAGMNVTLDLNRIPLDRVTRLELVKRDGTTEPIDMNRRYRVVANMYAINMLSSVRSMTKGIVAIDPTEKDGTPITDFYAHALHYPSGRELKEWEAFCGYLASFDQVNGVAQVPQRYSGSQGRKVTQRGSFLSVLMHPAGTTLVVEGVVLLILLIIVYRIATHKKRKARKAAKKLARLAKKAAG